MPKTTEVLPGHPLAQFYVLDGDGLVRGGYQIRQETDNDPITYTVHAVGFVPEVGRANDGGHDVWFGKAGVIQHAQNLAWMVEHEQSFTGPGLAPVPTVKESDPVLVALIEEEERIYQAARDLVRVEGKPGWARKPGSIALYRVDL